MNSSLRQAGGIANSELPRMVSGFISFKPNISLGAEDAGWCVAIMRLAATGLSTPLHFLKRSTSPQEMTLEQLRYREFKGCPQRHSRQHDARTTVWKRVYASAFGRPTTAMLSMLEPRRPRLLGTWDQLFSHSVRQGLTPR